MTACTLVELDVRPKTGQIITITATITERSTGNPYDVTGKVITGHYQQPDNTAGSSAGTIVDGPNGIVQWISPVLAAAGRWYAEIDADGVRTDVMTWSVANKIGG